MATNKVMATNIVAHYKAICARNQRDPVAQICDELAGNTMHLVLFFFPHDFITSFITQLVCTFE